jgi:hypothetical protein
MRSVLRRAALVACAWCALAGGALAQTTPSDSGVVRPPPAGSPGDVVAPPPSPDTGSAVKPPALGTRTPPDVAPPGAPVVRPNGPADVAPPATTQAPPARSRSASAPTARASAAAQRAHPPATAPSNVGRGVDPVRGNPAHATDPSNPVDPAAADPSRPADPTRAREKAPQAGVMLPGAQRAEAEPGATPPMRVAEPALRVVTRDAFAHPARLDASPSPLAACIQERDRALRARCVHDASAAEGARIR